MIHIYYQNEKTYCRRNALIDDYCVYTNIDETSCIKCLEKFTYRFREYTDSYIVSVVECAKQRLLKLTYNKDFDKLINE